MAPFFRLEGDPTSTSKLFPHPTSKDAKSKEHRSAELDHKQAANFAKTRKKTLVEVADEKGQPCSILPNRYGADGKAIVPTRS